MTEVQSEGGDGRAPLRVIQSPDPGAAADDLRTQHDADVATDLASAEAQVRRRVEAGRKALRPDGVGDEADVLARAAAIRAAAAEEPPISDADVEELERLAADLARAARIRTRTEARFNENLQAKLAASSGVALHPGAIKEAGEAVVAAEAALADAERALAAHGPRPIPGTAEQPDPDFSLTRDEQVHAPGEDPVLSKPLDDFDEVALDRRRAAIQGVAIFCVLTGVGVMLLGLDFSPVIAVVMAVVGAVIGISTVVRGRRAADLLADDKAHSASRLADLPDASGLGNLAGERRLEDLLGESAPEPEPVVAPTTTIDEDEDPWLDRRLELDAARDEAEELVRTARRRWHQLVGVDADPYDAETVIRAHDPQLAYDEKVALASPTVRTVAAFHRKAQARWRVLWNSLGHDDPPEAEHLEATLEAILGEHRRRQADLARLEAAEARAQADVDASRPLVFVEPATWVSATRLAQLISSIPPQGEVFVVERASSPAVDGSND